MDDNDLLLHIVRSIPAKERDDGELVLHIDDELIGDNTFTVKGNLLTDYNDENESEVTFEMNDDKVWKLQFALRPKQLMDLECFFIKH